MARLTEEKKKIFDYKLNSFLTTLNTDTFNVSDIMYIFEDMQINYNIRNVLAGLDRLNLDYCYNNKIFTNVKIIPSNTVTYIDKADKITKEKNILYFNAKLKNKNEIIIGYDFISGDFINTSDFIADSYLLSYKEQLLQYEWIYNYATSFKMAETILNFLSSNRVPFLTMPKGINNYFIDHYPFIQREEFLVYYIVNNCGINKKYSRIINGLLKFIPYSSLINIFNKYHFNIEILLKIIKNSINNGDFEMERKIDAFFYKINECINDNNKEEIFSLIDTNRDLEHNIKSFKNYLEKEKNNLLAIALQKLNFINNMTFGKNNEYTVIVPQSQIDKQDEGKQQNNCVGYYYDDSILRGDNYIYFLRKTDNTKKSYITCRYNMACKETSEYRKINNTSVKDIAELEIIKQISKIITEKMIEKEREV